MRTLGEFFKNKKGEEYAGKFKISKKLKKWLILIVILVLLLVGLLIVKGVRDKKMIQQPVVNETKVVRMDITSSITGAATIQPKDMYSVTSLVTGDVIADTFMEGDVVSKGKVLYKIDAKDIEKSITSAELSVKKAQQSYNDAVKSKSKNAETNKKNLESAQISLDRAKQSYKDAQEAFSDLEVKSDASGIISKLYVKEGDNVSNGMNIADVYDNSSLQVKIPFNEDDALKINVGQTATVTVVGNNEILNGTVTEVNNASEIKNGYMQVRYVTIRVNSPGALTPTDCATANIGDLYCNDAGNFEYITEKTITAKTSGTVKKINIFEKNKVASGDVIVTLESETLETQLNNAALSLKEAEISYSKVEANMDDYSADSQIASAKMSLQDAQLNLEKVRDNRKNYEITAPISGTVVTKNVKSGDKLDNSSSLTEMAVIYDMSSLNFDLNVDELDISKISVGQDVKISADALEGKIYTGKVTNVSINGTQSNGVTTYPVSVEIKEFDDKLIPGMNIDAEIVVERVTNVVAVPVSAVTRGNMVYVKGKKESEEDRAPEGYKTVKVETGVYNDDFIEITKGLKEGDTVWIQSIAGRSFGMGGGMPGGMGGGMPGGMGGGMGGARPAGGMAGGR